MFGGLGRCFEEDPFFRDPFAAHHEHMRQMMRSFSEPFGREPFPSLPEGRDRGERALERRARPDSRLAPRGNRRDADFGDPFSAMDRMMSNMRNNMLEMHRKFDDLSMNPDGHTFSSSSMMTYSKVGDEPPKVFQASAQTRTAPGGVKETRKALKDSESGLEQMAIGHHLQDRAHVIKKSKNCKTGDEEMNQEFINLDENEAESFDEEWQKEVMKFRPSRTRSSLDAPKSRSINYKENGSKREKLLGTGGSRVPKDSLESLSVRGTHVPLNRSSRK
ncbi:myeloid leukemia factor 1 isoform X2 [Neopelma chrysocephalum]|uniref:myeloid leukemia factor 1 isoform X2 n=1 Tax=Neopelma chrysocephalum TaxID=114329 RepID=UPI000FCD0BC9|nr:myeloid leukemia factor 1 isoform X2 [Neopelma chrysocephalum]